MLHSDTSHSLRMAWSSALMVGALGWALHFDRPAAIAAEAVDYEKQIKPLLAQRCVSCHGPLKQEGGLRVDAAALLKKGGDSGPAIVPKDLAKSRLIDAVSGTNGYEGGDRMPKDAAPLTAEEIAALKTWIQEGAVAPLDEKVAAGPADHWAFQKPVRPLVPQPKDAGWVRTPIDAFLAIEREKRGLTPAREAPKAVLLRRLHLDLIGLPPTPAELREFLADASPEAYEKAVQRLLDSPHYGERWGRHWMDVWRYSDWYGYGAELRNSSRHIWRWRDWIVRSLNEDKPYDRMIVEMLAADELDPGNVEALAATGFLTRQYFKFNRNVWLENTIEHTSKAFLGITLNCARCHEHKYDPISQEEFYQVRAIFEPYQVRTDRWRDANLEKEGLDLAYDAALQPETFVFERGNEATPLKDKPISPAVPSILGKSPFVVEPVKLPATQWYPSLRPEVREALLAEAEAKIPVAKAELAQSEAALATARAALLAARQKADAEAAIAELPGPPPAAAAPMMVPKTLLHDTFAAANAAAWKIAAGDWQYERGRLVQKHPAPAFQSIVTRRTMPRDLTIELKYRTTGGSQYKSIGISFDQSAEGTFDAVYGSAGGGKLQVMSSRAGAMAYPPEGARPYVFELNRDLVLRLDLRDTLLNVSIDGKFVLAYRLPERRDGALAVWTYDATGEFLSFTVQELPANVELKPATGAAPATPAGEKTSSPEPSLAAAEAALRDAEAAMAAAKLRVEAAVAARESVVARLAADAAKFAIPPATDAGERARQAVARQREEAVLTARAAVQQAAADHQRAVRTAAADPSKAKAATDAQAKREAAGKALDTATAASAKPLDEAYTPLGPVYPSESTGRRLALARWIAHRDNPLTARVAVNQIWMRHFGQPLVPTVFDFGLNGKPSTHPELLDWLACELMDNGWRMKPLHRQIVLSAAYRMDSQSAAFRANGGVEASAVADPENRWYARMNSRRMEAEIVRDSLLAIVGNLDRQAGGAEIDEKQGLTTFRRSLYYRHAPEKFMTFLEVFDSANTTECYRRIETVVPQQALALVNSQLAIEHSRRFAAQLTADMPAQPSGAGPSTDDRFISAAFERILCRPPAEEEAAACRKFLTDQSAKLADGKSLTAFSTGTALSVKASADPRQRARENLVHVLFNHTEFVTIR